MAKVVFNAVSKRYAAYFRPADRLRELVWPRRGTASGEFWALREVSFDVATGETLCLIGANGSGKSTSLQLAAGILRPTEGTVEVQGRVAALLELGAGFHPDFTGRENARLSASLFGLSGREIRDRFAGIEEFAEIGDFMDRPVKTYSTGMVVRLAFAVAISVEPEILLVDEALAVGDYYFRQRCMRKVHELRRKRVTILFVSHAMADVQALGTRALWLDGGRVAELGEPSAVVRKYLARMADRIRTSSAAGPGAPGPEAPTEIAPARAAARNLPNIDQRFGTGRAEVTGIEVLDGRGRAARALVPCQQATVRITARAARRIAAPNIGFMMRNHLGIDFAGTNTAREGCPMDPMEPGEARTVDFHLDVPELYAGSFSFAPAIADGDLVNYEICDWVDNALALPMARGPGEVYGYMHLPCRAEVVDVREI
ncbi:MAG: ABC transporter ATP-binding protein [Bryobacterales bacterium]|nr:ABC transporter ATP-binding protein [Bryobacterales bacterium]